MPPRDPAWSDLVLAGLRIRALADDRADGCMLARVDAERGVRVPAHVHARQDGWLLVVAGEVDVERDGERLRLGPRDGLGIARGVPHALQVTSDHARLLIACDPGCLPLVRALAESAVPGALPFNPDDRAALLAGAGMTLLPPSTPKAT